MGGLLGRVVFALSPRYRRRALENLGASGLAGDAEDVRRMARENATQIGMGVTELAWALFRPPEDVTRAVRDEVGWEAVERARTGGRAVIFVTPHLGSYDIAGRHLWTRLPILAMYRPHKIGWLDELIREGRNRGASFDGSNVAPATMAGVKMLLKHLRKGGCSVVLPDQVPGEGDGVWAPFFGRPAYTMTLLGRLQESSGAVLVFCYAERLALGEGFRMHYTVLDGNLSDDRAVAARQVNAMVERLVRECPSQYLWGYNRYKHPAGAPPPPA
ncbi:lysophospholipid acyltransferase family protein [Usitatibacter palustris]|uniref:Lipid A biosynthesis palmitoleoyltransferase n=1 Tax=Usitatibacter palustris TaxID=2732487 RepID=A0A6M4H9Q7_9PROT|nr:Lipid A biosynthesis palmitoleoyltransferase [Usitatibacter palustris]